MSWADVATSEGYGDAGDKSSQDEIKLTRKYIGTLLFSSASEEELEGKTVEAVDEFAQLMVSQCLRPNVNSDGSGSAIPTLVHRARRERRAEGGNTNACRAEVPGVPACT